MIPQLPENWPSVAAAVAVLAVVAWAAGWVATRILHRVISGVTSRTRATWDDRLIERGVFRRLAGVVPAVVVYLGIGPALGVTEPGDEVPTPETLMLLWTAVRRVAAAYIAFTVVRAFQACLDAVNDIYTEGYAEAKSRPIKGYLQVATLVAYLAAAVVIVAVLAGRSPLVFLSGLGALAAVLMLVFRDTILSLVASIQIASNDMIRIGDWVSVPQAGCDGEV
ncbi:MAG: mechanosensitive ion channel, partial [Gemmatimonadota bacterium]|nr:mechanosensitive ion channel [Gemmatimonadota bacterium]